MKIATTTVSLHGYHEARSESNKLESLTQARLTIYEEALEKAQKKRIDLLCLPGGYFFCASVLPDNRPPCNDPNLKTLEKQIIKLAKEYEISVAVGVDLKAKNQKLDHTEKIQKKYFLGVRFVGVRQRSNLIVGISVPPIVKTNGNALRPLVISHETC